MFQYSVASTVKLNVPSNPSVVVKRHQHIPTNYVKQSKVNQVKSTIRTNELLKNGGTLPPVLPDTVERKDGQISQSSCTCRDQRKITSQSKDARKGQKHTGQERKVVHKTSKLEQEMHCHPSCELSKVQIKEIKDTSEEHPPCSVNNMESPFIEFEEPQVEPQVERIHRGFTVNHYIAMITEMNEYICLEPYDPAEFSISADINLQKKRNVKCAWGEKTDISKQQNRKDILSAIHEELAEWKNGTQS